MHNNYEIQSKITHANNKNLWYYLLQLNMLYTILPYKSLLKETYNKWIYSTVKTCLLMIFRNRQHIALHYNTRGIKNI